VLAYLHAADGSLTPAGSYATGGAGSGNGLGSQGAVVVSRDRSLLFAVNAGSDTISSFRITASGLELADVAPSGGDRPTSVSYAKGVLYALNAGVPNAISGFSVAKDGGLTPIAGSTNVLGPDQTTPSQVELTRDARQLVVTQRGTSTISTFAVSKAGVASPTGTYTSAVGGPFGFAFAKNDVFVVSDAGSPSGASSYRLERDGRVTVLTPIAVSGQRAACWTVISKNGRYAYVANGGGNVTGYRIDANGYLEPLDAGITAFIPGAATDEAISGNGLYLYVRNAAFARVEAFRIGSDGSLRPAAVVTGLPATAVGLAS
jgi:6-phosphogluconolactonase (cycloisomerase 2 family)